MLTPKLKLKMILTSPMMMWRAVISGNGEEGRDTCKTHLQKTHGLPNSPQQHKHISRFCTYRICWPHHLPCKLQGAKSKPCAHGHTHPLLSAHVHHLRCVAMVVHGRRDWHEAQAKLSRRVDSVKVKVLNPPRPGKKLLVLDIDYT
jgi:hypothetical protein